MPGLTIIGSGSYAPGPPVTNTQLARVMDTTDEWIKQRSGIEERHFVAAGEGTSDLGFEAAKRALEDAKLPASAVDYILLGTMTPEYVFPGSGGLIGAKLGIPGVPALDIRQQCAAMPFGFQIADGLVNTGAAETILVIGADAHAGFMPWEDWDLLYNDSDRKPSAKAYERATRHRAVSVLFGDGAGALVMQKSKKPGQGFIGAEIHTDGRDATQIYIPGGGFKNRPFFSPELYEGEEYVPRMSGKELFKNAVMKLPKVVRDLCKKHGVSLDDVDCFVAHQANDRINAAVRDALEIPEHKVPSNIARYGNTSGGTIPILVDELRRSKRIKEGDLLCFLALGAGINWGAVLMRL